MAKIIDFNEAKEKILKSKKIKDKNQEMITEYIKRHERIIDSISEQMVKRIAEVHMANTKKEYLKTMRELKMLKSAFNSVISRIKKAGLDNTQKNKLLLRVNTKIQEIQTTKQNFEKLTKNLIKVNKNIKKKQLQKSKKIKIIKPK